MSGKAFVYKRQNAINSTLPDLSKVENLDSVPKSSSSILSSGNGGLGGGVDEVVSLVVDIRFIVEKFDMDTKLVDRSMKLISVDDDSK